MEAIISINYFFHPGRLSRRVLTWPYASSLLAICFAREPLHCQGESRKSFVDVPSQGKCQGLGLCLTHKTVVGFHADRVHPNLNFSFTLTCRMWCMLIRLTQRWCFHLRRNLLSITPGRSLTRNWVLQLLTQTFPIWRRPRHTWWLKVLDFKDAMGKILEALFF